LNHNTNRVIRHFFSIERVLVIVMAAPISVQDFLALFIKKSQVLAVKIKVAKQENEARMAEIENESNHLLQTLELYLEEAKKPGFLDSQKISNPISTVNGVNEQQKIKKLSLSIKEFKTHMETQLSPAKLTTLLESHFPEWLMVGSFISKQLDRKVNKAKQENDDFLLPSGEEEEEEETNGVLKFESIEEENNLKVPLLTIIMGARSKRKKRGTSNKKRNKHLIADDGHVDVEVEVEESNLKVGTQKKQRKREDEDEDEDDCEEGDGESHKNSKEGQKKYLPDNSIRKKIINFIDRAWVHLGFDTFGAGDLHIVNNYTSSQVQAFVGIHLHQFLTKKQTSIKFLEEACYVDEERQVGPIICSEVDLLTVDGKIH